LYADVSELATSITDTCNINTYLLDYTASHPRRQLPSKSLLYEYQISQILLALYLAPPHLQRILSNFLTQCRMELGIKKLLHESDKYCNALAIHTHIIYSLKFLYALHNSIILMNLVPQNT